MIKYLFNVDNNDIKTLFYFHQTFTSQQQKLEKSVQYLQSQQKRYQKDAWRLSGVFFVNFKHISNLFLVLLLLTLIR